MKNGEFLKEVTVNKEEEDGADFAKANFKRKDNNEISVLLYLYEEKLLVTGSTDSVIRVYDESEPEESILLKLMIGGH